MPVARPSPDALLLAAKREERGRLKIFFGAAPGVGKTYEMLQTAHARKLEGVDVVVGVVETHGRAETHALVEGLEVLPRAANEYRGRTLEEMDVDAILKRRPELVLVDELAHTNAAGARHPKRWQDVEELLEAGIDVLTTMNVQHLESLNDIVARITRIRVRETVPDHVFDLADEVEVIDLTPDDLRKRLEAGKVYGRPQAERAVKHFFKEGNLTALRELALRRTAERVDADMRGYMQREAIEGPWPASERILVAIDERAGSAALVRTAKRLAERARASWLCVTIETARHARLSEEERDRVADTLRLAETLGGATMALPGGGDVAEDLLALAREQNVTTIIVGKATRSKLFELVNGSVVRRLIARSGPIGVFVMAGDGETVPPKTVDARPDASRPKAGDYAVSAAMVLMAGLIGLAIDLEIDLPNISMIFVPAILLSAVRYGLSVSLAASFLAAAAYNFLLVDPRYTFTVADPSNVVAIVFFTLTAVLASSVGARVRQQTLVARNQARVTADLHGFARKVAGIATADDLLWAASHQIAAMLKADVVLLTARPSGLVIGGAYPPEDELAAGDLAAATWCFEHEEPTGRGASTLPGARRLFLPLKTARGKLGVAGVARTASGPVLTPSERRLLDALADQTAVALERIQLAEDVDTARIAAEAERLRSALLTSVSHDLKTPLATIMGAVTSLRSYGALYDETARDEMLASAQEETERLSRFVANLLDIVRLDTGAVAARTEAIDLAETVGSALRRTAGAVGPRPVALAFPDEPLIGEGDPVLLEQALVNILENAGKYTPETAELSVRGFVDGEHVTLAVSDTGPGLAAADLPHLFDKFYRSRDGDRRPAGTGLGLAIAKGFVEAMGGTVEASNRPGGGARFDVRLRRSRETGEKGGVS